jgi:hypothetical protein
VLEDPAGPKTVSCADALVLLAEAYLAGGRTRYPEADRYRVIVHLEASQRDPSGPPSAGLHPDQPLPAALRRLISCDGDLYPVFLVHGEAVASGRKHRIVPRALRRLVERRQHGRCAVPGCSSTHLVMHHIIHWEDDGETEPANIVGLCSRHHRQHHLGLVGIAGNASVIDGLAFTTITGRRMPPVGRPVPPSTNPAPPEVEIAPYRHPSGEVLQRRHLWITPDPATRHVRSPAAAGTTTQLRT